MIDRKFAVLMKLKHRVKIFKEHLIEHQECEQKMFMAQEQMTQNEEMLLMDDLEEDNWPIIQSLIIIWIIHAQFSGFKF